MEDSTKGIHAGEPKTKVGDPVVQPIYQSTNYIFGGETHYKDIRYIRLNNSPNHKTLHEKLAALEGGEDALVSASGMAAISSALLALVPPKGELLAQSCLYGGTAHFLGHYFENLGRKVRFFKESDNLEKMIGPDTKALYVEAASNPLLRIPEFSDFISVAKKHSLLTFIDNTILSPINFKPLSVGFDISLHSATKYLNGHSDIVAGAAIGARAHIDKIRDIAAVLGGALDPHACFLLDRGLKSLDVRVKQHNVCAQELAQALEDHPRVTQMSYPGLKSHLDYERARRYFKGGSGVFSFEYKGTVEEADRFIRKLALAKMSASLGGVETLITRPVTTSHSSLSKEQLKELGIKDTLVRVSVGIEDPKDLIKDFLGALG